MAPPFLTSSLDGGELSASRPGRFTPGERAPDAHWIGGWVGHRAGLDTEDERKISFPQPEIESQIPTKLIRDFCIFTLSNSVRSSASARCSNAADSLCQFFMFLIGIRFLWKINPLCIILLKLLFFPLFPFFLFSCSFMHFTVYL
jgi:hypothetical protein